MVGIFISGIGFGVALGVCMVNIYDLSQEKRSVTVNNRQYVIEPSGYRDFKIWSGDYPDYFVRGHRGCRVWEIVEKGSSNYLWSDIHTIVKIIHNANKRQAVKAFDAFLFEKFIEPTFSDNELLARYLSSDSPTEDKSKKKQNSRSLLASPLLFEAVEKSEKKRQTNGR